MADVEGTLRSWLGGPIGHVHMRPNLAESEQHTDENIRFTVDGFLAYLQRFSGVTASAVTDTDHPYSDSEGKLITSRIRPATLESIRQEVSAIQLARARELHAHPERTGHVYTGVEADIVGPDGRLIITDDVLGQLDLVICSLHYTLYSNATALKDRAERLSMAEIIGAYTQAVSNPHIDVLGHPTREIGRSNKNIENLPLWLPLLDLMKEKGVAFELNLAHMNSLGQDAELERAVTAEAAKRGLPLFIGFDLHDLKELGLPSSTGTIEPATMRTEFEANRDQLHLQLMLKLMRLIRSLEQIGIAPENVVNSSDERFRAWLAARPTSA